MSNTKYSTELQEITQEDIQRAIRRAQQIRSEAFAHYLRQFSAWARQSLRTAPARPRHVPAHLLSNSH
jgi:hypothetical protein